MRMSFSEGAPAPMRPGAPQPAYFDTGKSLRLTPPAGLPRRKFPRCCSFVMMLPKGDGYESVL
jgi:hypothetical protein